MDLKKNYLSVKSSERLGLYPLGNPINREPVKDLPLVEAVFYPSVVLLDFRKYSFMDWPEYQNLILLLRNLKEEEVRTKVKSYKILTPTEINKNPEEHERIMSDLVSNLPKIVTLNSKLKKAYSKFMKRINNEFPEISRSGVLDRLIVYEWKEFGLFSFLLRDDLIEEIYISSASDNPQEYSIYLDHREYGRTLTNLTFRSSVEFIAFLNVSGAFLNRAPSPVNPLVNTKIPVGRGGRVQITFEPASQKKIAYVNIRMFPSSPFNLLKLLTFESLPSFIIPYFIALFETKGNLVVCGETGSGKTTLLNSILGLAPLNLRTIVVEETPEIILEGFPFLVKLVATENAPLKDIISSSLRQTPQIYILGEIRTDEEIKGFLRTTSAGQANISIATFHAGTIEGFIERLQKEANASIPQIKTIDVVVFQNKLNVRKNSRDFILRRMTGVYETLRDMDEELFKMIKEKIKETYGIKEESVLDYLKKELELLGSIEIKVKMSNKLLRGKKYTIKDEIVVKILNISGEVIYFLKILDYNLLDDTFTIYLGSLRKSRIIANFMKKLKITSFDTLLNIFLRIVTIFEEKLKREGFAEKSFLDFVINYQIIREKLFSFK